MVNPRIKKPLSIIYHRFLWKVPLYVKKGEGKRLLAWKHSILDVEGREPFTFISFSWITSELYKGGRKVTMIRNGIVYFFKNPPDFFTNHGLVNGQKTALFFQHFGQRFVSKSYSN